MPTERQVGFGALVYVDSLETIDGLSFFYTMHRVRLFSLYSPISTIAVLMSSASASALTPSSPNRFAKNTRCSEHKTRPKRPKQNSQRLLTAQINFRHRRIALERVGQRFDAFVTDVVSCDANHGAIKRL